MNKRQRWVERNYLTDISVLFYQHRLGWKLYISRVSDLKRTSGLGLLAPFISIFVHVCLLGTVMSLVFNEPTKQFIPFFSISICIWQVISTFISESSISNEKSAQFLNFPHISGHMNSLINIYELVVSMFLKVLAALLIVLIVDHNVLLGCSYLGFFLGLLLVAIVMFSWALPMSYIFDRYRVLRGFLPQMLFVIYLITPILWDPSRLAGHMWVAEFNPVYHIVELVRSPLLSGSIPKYSILVSLAVSFLGFVVSTVVYERNKMLVVFRWIA